ncbi:MAG: ribose 5-phosphate isomerase B [Bacteroidales bacterium]
MDTRKIAIASDHAGFRIKESVKKFLIASGHVVKDFGTYSEESVDYPDYAHPLAQAVDAGKYDLGITVCGSGNGINMTANKHQGIRSALCWNEEISRLSRFHNDANVCALPGRFVSESEALLIVRVFLETPFEGGRHQARIRKIPLKRI